MKSLVIAALALTLFSCHWAKEKSREAVNGTGEIVGKARSEFASGVAKGVEKTFSRDVKISPALAKAGLATGKIIVTRQDSCKNDNVLNPYFIYNESIDRDVTAKLFTEDILEYGRATRHLKGNKGSAGYTDFVFDHRTDIDLRGRITIE